ncbi:glycosyltransferase family 2 protein [Leptospira sp. WS39.C2]
MQNKNPLVTIITVVRNAEDTIARTISSALNQKNVSFEVLVWDGLSTDRTVEQIKTFGDRVRFYSGKDSGVYDAMNKAFPLAKGKWILFLNADDYFLHPLALEKLLIPTSDPKVDYVCGEAKMLFGLKRWKPKTLTDFDFFIGNPSNHQAYLCKKDIYTKLNGFNIKFRYSADVDFMFRVIQKGYLGKSIQEPVVHYSLGGLSTKNVGKGVSELESIMAHFLNSDLEFAREARLVFHEGRYPRKSFLVNLASRKLSESQWRQILLYFGSKVSAESTSFASKLFSFFKVFLINMIKKAVFLILSLLPKRVL